MLLAAPTSAAAVSAILTPLELASAIDSADFGLVPYRTRMMAPADIREVQCVAADEEPTEFRCRWQQRIKGGWVKRTTWLAVDDKGWHVMDA